MKKSARVLALILALSLLGIPVSAAGEDWIFRSGRYGFSFALPEELAKNIIIEEYAADTLYVHTPAEKGWSADSGSPRDVEKDPYMGDGLDGIFRFVYIPAAEADGWSGELGTLRVKTPKSAFFSEEYSYYSCPVIAVNAGSAFVSVMPIGGMDSDGEHMEAYMAAMNALNASLSGSIKADGGAAVPGLDESRIPAQAEKLNALPDAELTRAGCAQLLYELICPESGALEPECRFPDISADMECAQAVAYLADFGIVAGYPDGTFRPEQRVTRAEFVKMLHRALFIPFPAWYGEPIEFSDVDEGHWAWDYLNYACRSGMLTGGAQDLVWLRGYPDGTLRPDAEVSCGEAAIIISRLVDEG